VSAREWHRGDVHGEERRCEVAEWPETRWAEGGVRQVRQEQRACMHRLLSVRGSARMRLRHRKRVGEA